MSPAAPSPSRGRMPSRVRGEALRVRVRVRVLPGALGTGVAISRGGRARGTTAAAGAPPRLVPPGAGALFKEPAGFHG